MVKLVRDRIPDIIRQSGRVPQFHIASDEEFRSRLQEKLKEEVAEFIENPCVEELADIMEVINAICEDHGYSREMVEGIRKTKEAQRGGFKKRIVLEEY